MFRRVLLVFLLVFGISFALPTLVTDCMNITAPGHYYMNGDIVNYAPLYDGECITQKACILIQSDDVSFNCNYNTIYSGPTVFDALGITNVTLANCSLNASGGKPLDISLCQMNDTRMENLKITSAAYGILLEDSNYTYIYNLTHQNLGRGSILQDCNNLTIINATGLSATSSGNFLNFQNSDDVYSRDLYNVSLWFSDSSNSLTQNLYSPDPYQGFGWRISSGGTPTLNHRLRNAYVSDCDDGGATACISFQSKGVSDVHIENVELVGASDYMLISHSTHTDVTLTDAESGLNIGTDNVTVDGMDIDLTGMSTDGIALSSDASNISINDVSITFSTTKPRYGIYLQPPGASPYKVLDNVTFSNIGIANSATGVYLGDSAKGFVVDGLTITNATERGIEIIYSGFMSVCDPSEALNDITSHHFFTDVAIDDSVNGVWLEDDVCDIHFDGVEIDAADRGFHTEPSAGGGGGSQLISLTDFEITVSNATGGVGINLSKNYDSNYTNGDVSGGAYCIWTYRARENNTYDALELHDCDTGFLLSNTITPPSGDFLNLTGVHIYNVLLDFDASDFWYLSVFEDVFFGDVAGGLGIEFYTYGCLNFNSTTLPAPLPAGHTPFHGNYLEITEDTTSPSCSVPGKDGFTNQTAFLWSAAQEAGYDMSTLRVLRWNGTNWIEVPGVLDLNNRLFEAGLIENFSIFTMTAAEAPGGGGGDGGTSDKGGITLTVPAESYVLEPVSIHTFDDHGDPLNAKVSVTLGGETIFYGFVGADGEVEVIPLEQGSYTVVATKDNYDAPPAAHFMALLRDLDASVSESVGEDEQFSVTVASEGAPLEGARAEIDGLVRITGTEGTTTFTLSEPGNYHVEVTKAGYTPWSGIINVWEEDEKPEPSEVEEPGIVIIGEEEEPEEETLHPPIVQGEVPSVESQKQPVNGIQTEFQQHWLWLIFLLLIVLAAIIYWLIKNREKK